MRERFEPLSKIVEDTGVEIGLSVNTTNILGSQDADTKQLGQFTIASAEELLTRQPWRNRLGTDPWVMSESGEYKHEVTSDSDVILIDSRLLKLGARWRYLHAKGLTYNEDFRSYELRRDTFAYYENDARPVDLNEEIMQ